MNHNKRLKTLDRKAGPRRALYRTLLVSLIRDERIVTTSAKAKAVKPQMEHLITKALKNDLSAKRFLMKRLSTAKAVTTLLKTIAPRYTTRKGGYTRIIRLAPRQGDGAELVQLELVD